MVGVPLYKLSDAELRLVEADKLHPEGITLREAEQRRAFAKMILSNREQQKRNPAAFTNPANRSYEL